MRTSDARHRTDSTASHRLRPLRMSRIFPTAADVIATDLAQIASDCAQEFRALEGRRVLLTGGAGFLGYYLVHAICHWNITHPGRPPIGLTIYENFIRGTPLWLTALQTAHRFEVVVHDITQPMPSDAGHFDFVVHAASIASPIYYRRYPIQTMDANVNGLRHLLDYAVAEGERGATVSGFLFFSTSEIYGDPQPEWIPTPEEYRGNVSCTGPRACYDESKRYGETLCVNFASEYGIPVRVARPFNNYGPGLKITDRRVLPDFVRDIMAGRDITMLSDGSPTRTFCYISDAIAGYLKILVKGRSGEAYNIGVETPEISMAELAERVVAIGRDMFSYGGKIVYAASDDRAYLTDNPNRRSPVIAKARADLGYDPKVDIATGLERAFCWYRENHMAEDA